MRVLIPAVAASCSPDGITRHAVNLARCLMHISAVTRVHLIVAAWQQASVRTLLSTDDERLELSVIEIHNGAWARNRWYWRELPQLALALEVDLVHTAYPVPIQRSSFPCPIVTTLHDLYPWDAPHNFGYPRVLLNRLALRQCLRNADAIACVSASTLARLGEHSPAAHRKACCILNSVETCERGTLETTPWMQRLQGSPFLLCVAQHRRNKNLPLTLEIFHRLRPSQPGLMLLLVGGLGPETYMLQALIDRFKLRPHVTVQSGLTDEQMQWCYRNAGALLASSTVEGFGLPVAEAMLAGCAVVCSDIPAFRELGQGHCQFISLAGDATTRFHDALVEVLHRERPRPIPLPHLSAPVLAERYLRLYQGLLRRHVLPVRRTLHCNETEGGLR